MGGLRTGFKAVDDDDEMVVVVIKRQEGLTHVGILGSLFATDGCVTVMGGASEGAGDGRAILGKGGRTGGSEHVDRTSAGRAEGGVGELADGGPGRTGGGRESDAVPKLGCPGWGWIGREEAGPRRMGRRGQMMNIKIARRDGRWEERFDGDLRISEPVVHVQIIQALGEDISIRVDAGIWVDGLDVGEPWLDIVKVQRPKDHRVSIKRVLHGETAHKVTSECRHI